MTRIEAITEAYQKKTGTLEELKVIIGEKHLRALQLTGVIHRGQNTQNEDTWSMTNEWKNILDNKQTKTSYNPFNFIVNIINHLLLNKSKISL